MKYITVILLIAAIVGIAVLVLNRCNSDKTDSNFTQNPYIKTDTIYREVPAKPLIISNIKTRIVYRTDTIIQTQPFTAVIDTIMNNDTLQAKFSYPENNFSMLLLRRPDTVAVQKITIYEPAPVERKWWEIPVCIIGGAAMGYVFGRIK